jgi:hypothetical protein
LTLRSSGSIKTASDWSANGVANARPSETFAMSDRTIASIARDLALALLKAAQRDNAHDEPQREISKLEKELIEAYRAEAVETLRV